MKPWHFAHLAVICTLSCMLLACEDSSQPASSQPTKPGNLAIDRLSKIPAQAVKIIPENDIQPPVVYSDEYEQPVPVPGRVNTAGGEDSPFITPGGDTLYFFFTPDVSVPAEKQLLDGVTGIYRSEKINGIWNEPERIYLQDAGKIALDGCEFVLKETMWFCSSREGFSGINWFTASYQDGMWQNWKLADFPPEYQVGELHISGAGDELYFASARAGGKGQLDIWLSRKIGGTWQELVNISVINTPDLEGWPALNPNEDELWFYRNYGLWRSTKANGAWNEPELVVSPLAGEPSVDSAGNLYFVHHFYKDGRMVEADIYVAYKK